MCVGAEGGRRTTGRQDGVECIVWGGEEGGGVCGFFTRGRGGEAVR